MRSPKFLTLIVGTILVAIVAAQVDAQQERNRGQRGQGGQRGPGGPGGPGGFQGRGGPGGGGGLLGLVRIDQVKKELELLDEQNADIDKLAEEQRTQRAGDRPDFQNLSDEERRAAFEKLRAEREALSEAERTKQDEERRAQQREQEKVAETKLAEILLPHQMDRLKQIQVQLLGIRALTSDDVAAAIGLSASERSAIDEAIQASGEKMRAEMQTLFQGGGGNREGMREKIAEITKGINDEILAKLSDAQRDKFAALKGEPFEMPQFGFGGPGGFGGGPGRGGPGGAGGRPQRPPQ